VEKSHFKTHLEIIRTEVILQEIYIKDVVKIFLIEYRLNTDYLNIVLIIISKIIQSNTNFYEKVYEFLKNKLLLL
jgi:hypothetical protein